ncbi:peptidoglycan binding protein CsiV [Dongshaea marina]|uniref:peptidoglycan binding protein CsiV n=1 Tax=Dongshaea marina TaxID=2047966 RepID=UPI00131F143F|nr:peptidoglycan binding protein CsiV [Dongshaea marina]
MKKVAIFIPLLMLASMSQAWAAPRFEIEMILFERNVNPASINENWQAEAHRPDFTKARSLLPPDAHPYPATVTSADINPSQLPRGVTLLSNQQLQLNRAFARISQDPSLTPLLHLGWRQPVYSKRRAQIWHIIGGNNLCPVLNQDDSQPNPLTTDNAASQESEGMVSSVTENDGATTLEVGSPDSSSSDEASSIPLIPAPSSDFHPCWSLDGTLRIYLRHYLYIETDMLLREKSDQPPTEVNPLEDKSGDTTSTQADDSTVTTQVSDVTSSSENEPNTTAAPVSTPANHDLSPNGDGSWIISYPMEQFRRVRSSEIHYFDHPLMGMIIQIRKIPKAG